jgi:methionine-rich copper-binding protein CopC
VDAVPRHAGSDAAAVVPRWLVALLLVPTSGWAHAFPDHSDPRVGHTVDAPPPTVRIWFDGEIEPVFSTIRVEDADQRRVDKGDGRVDAKNRTLLEVNLSLLPSGRYEVVWSVIARDGHRTEGRFKFRVK